MIMIISRRKIISLPATTTSKYTVGMREIIVSFSFVSSYQWREVVFGSTNYSSMYYRYLCISCLQHEANWQRLYLYYNILYIVVYNYENMRGFSLLYIHIYIWMYYICILPVRIGSYKANIYVVSSFLCNQWIFLVYTPTLSSTSKVYC